MNMSEQNAAQFAHSLRGQQTMQISAKQFSISRDWQVKCYMAIRHSWSLHSHVQACMHVNTLTATHSHLWHGT